MANRIKLLKKCVTIFTSACILFSTFTSFAADEKIEIADISEKNKEAYGLIAAISDCEKYLPADAQEVTRSMFISAACVAAGIDAYNSANSAFEDVAMGTDVYGFVSYAVNNDIISQSELFRPDDTITKDEAAKIIINIFGYGIVADANGGWPDGYRKVSAQVDLMSGVNGDSLTVSDVYRMLFNMLNANHVEMQIKEGVPEYITNDTIILEEYYKINKITGIVTSNEYTEIGSISGAEKSANDLMETMGVDGVYYDVKTHDFNNLIGCRVRAYIKKDNESDNDQIIYMKGYNNNEVTVNSGDLHYENNELRDETAKKRYKIKKSADIIVNGKADYSFPLSKLEDVVGTIRLVSTESSHDYNLAIITDYKYMKVSTFDKQELEIADMENYENKIKITDDSIVTVYSEDENVYTTIGDISKNSYLAVAASKDSEIIDITIMATFADGKVNAIDDEEIVINNIAYAISPFFKKESLSKIKVGYEGSFYVGKNNEIIAPVSIESKLQYGYLVESDFSNTLKKNLEFKIFTQKGEMVVFECADKIKIDGTLTSNIENAKATYFNNPCFLKYAVNGEGKINVIDLPVVMDTYKNIDDANLNPDNNLTRNALAGSYYYRNNVFYPSFFGYEAMVFLIPLDRTSEQDYRIGYTFNEGGISDGSQIEAYDVGFDGNAKAICAYMDTNDKNNVPLINAYSIVIEKVYQKSGSDGFFRTAVRGWSESGFVDLILKDGIGIEKFNDVGELDTGDIIRVLMKDNEVTALVVDFCGSDFLINSGVGIAPFNCRSTNYHYQTGSVYSLYNSAVLISKTNLGENVWDYSGSNLISVKMPTNVLVVNIKDRKIRTASEDALKTYLNSGADASRVVIKQTNGNSNYCVIFEGMEDM